MQSASAEVPRTRVYSANVTVIKSHFAYNGEYHDCQLGVTGYGDDTFKFMDLAQGTAVKDYKNPHFHYKMAIKACPDLDHKNRILVEHIQVNWIYY
jgi:hypothetical protein